MEPLAATDAQAKYGTTGPRPSPHSQWHLLDPAHWAPWRELPWRYGPWPTVANRFYRWRQAGIWERIGTELKQLAQQRCQ
ncbi:MAG: hypothetical protein BRC52_12455, partial [Cyanobacteria bacterium SW_5_48_44]